MKANNGKKHIQGDKTPIYLTPDSTLQTPSEYEHDRKQNVRKDDSISVSNDDLHDPNTDREADNDQEGSNSED